MVTMAGMDPHQLYSLFAATIQADEATRKHAEAALKEVCGGSLLSADRRA